MFAKKGIRGVHKVIPAEREWLSVLSAINAQGESIPNYYIFKGVRKLNNYVALCEEGAMMGMQKKGWMDTIHFIEWMDHFIHKLEKEERLSENRRNLLILDGHKLHINMEVLMKAREHCIDMISLPSHTSHELQPLDKACFKPFKVAFRAYRDLWNLTNSGRKCKKENLAQWASLALQKALTKKNIESGFRGTGIWPLNLAAMTQNTTPSEAFIDETQDTIAREAIFEEGIPTAEGDCIHYYGSEADVEEHQQQEGESATPPSPTAAIPRGNVISNFLKLPRGSRPTVRRGAEPLVDYSQSQLLTSSDHLSNLEIMARKKKRVQEEKLQRAKEKELNRARKTEEREANKKRKAQEKEANKLAREVKAAQQAEIRAAKGKRRESLPPVRRIEEVDVGGTAIGLGAGAFGAPWASQVGGPSLGPEFLPSTSWSSPPPWFSGFVPWSTQFAQGTGRPWWEGPGGVHHRMGMGGSGTCAVPLPNHPLPTSAEEPPPEAAPQVPHLSTVTPTSWSPRACSPRQR